MRDDFCIFILSHGRPDRVKTLDTLRRAGYTGKCYIVLDDEDQSIDEYRKNYGDMILVFSKDEAAEYTEPGDNFNDRRTPLYARNACFRLAKKADCRYFMELDDDYSTFQILLNSNFIWRHRTVRKGMDDLLESMLEYYESSPQIQTIAMAQGGEFIGGGRYLINQSISMRRKAMNSFLCSVDRPFDFFSRLNDDVTTYVVLGRQGKLFFTIMQLCLIQVQTQINPGGLTEAYLDFGTYVKSFYSIMFAPSCVKIGMLGDWRSPHFRIHHQINWHRVAPKILREEMKKESF